MIDLFFEWDEEKSKRNLRDRGFDFEYAAQIFAGPILEIEDLRRDYFEQRFVATGQVQNDLLVVVYTWRENRCRIISARPANRKERNGYYKAFS